MLYGADVGDRALVGEHSVIMKNEYLRPERYYSGAPTRPTKPCLIEIPEHSPEAIASDDDLLDHFGSVSS